MGLLTMCAGCGDPAFVLGPEATEAGGGMAASILLAVILVPILVMACFFLAGKGPILIAAYNGKTEAGRSSYNEKAIRHFTGALLLLFCLLLTGAYFAAMFDLPWLVHTSAWLIAPLVVPAGLIYMNTGGRFRKE